MCACMYGCMGTCMCARQSSPHRCLFSISTVWVQRLDAAFQALSKLFYSLSFLANLMFSFLFPAISFYWSPLRMSCIDSFLQYYTELVAFILPILSVIFFVVNVVVNSRTHGFQRYSTMELRYNQGCLLNRENMTGSLLTLPNGFHTYKTGNPCLLLKGEIGVSLLHSLAC